VADCAAVLVHADFAFIVPADVAGIDGEVRDFPFQYLAMALVLGPGLGLGLSERLISFAYGLVPSLCIAAGNVSECVRSPMMNMDLHQFLNHSHDICQEYPG